MSEPCGDANCEQRRGGLIGLIERHGWLGSIESPACAFEQQADGSWKEVPVERRQVDYYFGHSCGDPDCICAAATPTITKEEQDGRDE